MTSYTLPELRYDHGALEPHISARVMELHHDKHHRAYVDGANKAAEALDDARSKRSVEHVAALERALAFNVSGHVLHSIFWQNLSPDGGGEPEGDLASAITSAFGTFAAFKAELVQTSSTIMGSGWGVLGWEPLGRRLITLQIHDHQSDTAQGTVPLLVVDAWEHAYYLQYQTEKARYFEALWSLWSWSDVAERFAHAQSLDLALGDGVDEVPRRPARRVATARQRA